MKIKSNKILRYSIKTQEGADYSQSTDSDFIGDLHQGKKKLTKGFFSVYHGIKPDIYGYLHGFIYEIRTARITKKRSEMEFLERNN